MKTRVNDNPGNAQADKSTEPGADVQTVSPWHEAAARTAPLGAVFSLIVFAFLVLNYIQRTVYDSRRTEKLDTLKIELLDQPDNEQLISRIRHLDLQVRRDRIRRLDLSRKGRFLLLGSLAVLLIGLKWSAALKKKLPAPRARPDGGEQQARQAVQARRSVTAGLVVLGLGALFLATRQQIDFGQAGAAGASYPSPQEIRKHWPRFRGPGGLGISAYTNVPSSWNGKTGETIIWKSEVPLPGNNSPIVWGDRVFVSGADQTNRQVYCFDGLSGKLLWTGDVKSVAATNTDLSDIMEDTGFAAPTMVTDGRRVYAIFASGDLGCFSIDGRKVWEKSLGTPDSAYGYASSLTTHQNLLLVQYDQGTLEDEKSRLLALDVFSGHTIWATKRPVPNSWTSPVVARIDNQYQVIACGDPWLIAYDPNDGAELWRAECSGTDVAPSPIYAAGLVFAVEPYTKLAAIRPDGRGDVTKTHLAWTVETDAPDICSPLSNAEFVFLLTSQGTLTSYKVTDGTKLWEKDLEESFKASPSLVGNQVYLLSEQGVMHIIEAGPEYKELARCELGEECNASPAFVDGRIYIRGKKNLYCIGDREQGSKI